MQSAPAATGTLDADGNGRHEALADGLIVLRLLFGLSRQALVIGAIGMGAQHTFYGRHHRMARGPARAAVDVNANNATGPLTDGLMTLRYRFGFQPAGLTSGAIGAGPIVGTAPLIGSYISTLML
ncbi:MAG: hypothetical protein IPI73_18190 [Betaproteobacteria bacterium]|nr:hypothetical protein [Betaproteobacteria bacterium]